MSNDGLRLRLRLKARRGRGDIERVAGRMARTAGYELRRQSYYLPFPEVEELPEALWKTPSEMLGVDLRIDAGAAFLTDELAPLMAEFKPTDRKQAGGAFYLENGSYGSVDAETLYGMVRFCKPKRIVELGSGATTHVISRARRANAAEGHHASHDVFDPFPFANSMGPVVDVNLHRVPAEQIDVEVVERLEANDVFFIDTTHTVKTGGDVVRIYLDLMPRVPAGVYVHVHDIFLPYEYPRHWVVDERRAWAEQYLLQALLSDNPTWEVVLPTHALARRHPNATLAAVPSFAGGAAPGAIWMRRLAS